MKKLFIFILLAFSFFIKAQFGFNPDSLSLALQKMPSDTNKMKPIVKLCIYYLTTGHYNEAIPHIMELRKIAVKYNRKKAEGVSYNFMGAVYDDQGKYPQSIEAYLKAQKLWESINHKAGLADLGNNLGLVYFNTEQYDEALIQLRKAIQISTEISARIMLDNPLHNIGQIHNKKGNYDSALFYYKKALALREEFGKPDGLVSSYLSIGNQFQQKDINDSAVYYHKKCLEIARQMGEPKQIAYAEAVLGKSFLNIKKYNEAKELLLLAENHSREIGLLEARKNTLLSLVEVFEIANENESALKYYKLYIQVRDSLQNKESVKKQTELMMQHEFDKKEAATQLEQKRKDELANEEKKRQTLIRNSFIAGFIVLIVIFLYAVRSYNQKRKANIIISRQKEEVELQKSIVEAQKHLVEEKQREILDSITYARRIQRALITNEFYISKKLQELKPTK